MVFAAPPWGGLGHKRVAVRDHSGAYRISEQMHIVALGAAAAAAAAPSERESLTGEQLLRELFALCSAGEPSAAPQHAPEAAPPVLVAACFLPEAAALDEGFQRVRADAGAYAETAEELLAAPWGGRVGLLAIAAARRAEEAAAVEIEVAVDAVASASSAIAAEGVP